MHADDFRFSALSKGIQGGGSAPQASLQPVLPQSKSNYCKFYATKHGNSILPLFLISSYPNFCGYIIIIVIIIIIIIIIITGV